MFEKNYIEEFLNSEKGIKAINEEYETLLIRNNFVNDFPLSKINNMKLDEYLFSKKGYGYEQTFCSRMKNETQPVCSMGNAFPTVFGIYLKDGSKLMLDKTYERIAKGNYNQAFSLIKQDIITLIKAGEKGDVKTILKSRLNSLFKYKILSLYCIDSLIPVCTTTAINGYCDALVIGYDPSEEIIKRNLRIVKLKNEHPILKKWSNLFMMNFCDWLWRAGYTYDLKLELENISNSFTYGEKNDKSFDEKGKNDNNVEYLVKKSTIQTSSYSRNAEVKQIALDRARGKCALCGKDAPFLTKEGKPFLEIHHIIPLSLGGSDSTDNVVALCPNCHRKMHILNLGEDVFRLKNISKM